MEIRSVDTALLLANAMTELCGHRVCPLDVLAVAVAVEDDDGKKAEAFLRDVAPPATKDRGTAEGDIEVLMEAVFATWRDEPLAEVRLPVVISEIRERQKQRACAGSLQASAMDDFRRYCAFAESMIRIVMEVTGKGPMELELVEHTTEAGRSLTVRPRQ